MSTAEALRKPIRATYAHKRSRNTKTQGAINLLSSPLQIIGDQEDISRTEMARRMLKRSRHAGRSTASEDSPGSVDAQEQESVRKSKRTKRSHRPTQEYLITLNDLLPVDPTDPSQFQTPFGEEYIHPSAIKRPLVPEQMSPLPIANRILSRTASRNLKENSASSRTSPRGLASPFASRRSSANSSPKRESHVKTQSKSKLSRPALKSKSRSISSSHNNSQSQSYAPFHESNFTMNHSAQPSPRAPKPIMRNRYPSSHTLTQAAQQDWLVPPKTLTRIRNPLPDFDMHTPPDFGVVVGNSSFLADIPMAFSTPQPIRSSNSVSGTGAAKSAYEKDIYASRSRLSTPDSLDKLHSNRDRLSGRVPNLGDQDDRGPDDIVMTGDPPTYQPREVLHISGNSIFSSSGDFTIVSSRYPAPISAPTNNADNINEEDASDSLFRDPTVPTETLLNGFDTSHIRTRKQTQQYETAIPSMTSSLHAPAPAPTRALSSSFVDELLATAQPNKNPAQIDVESPESMLNDMFDDMALNGDAIGGHGPRKSKISSLTARTRSLDSPVAIQVESNNNGKGELKGRRNRAGTIRASDYQQLTHTAVTTMNTVPAIIGPHARRTRSGTVVGPRAEPTPVVSCGRRTIPTPQAEVLIPLPDQAQETESDDEILLKSPGWLDADFEYLGLPNHQFYNRALRLQQDDEPNDELLMIRGWSNTHNL